RGRGAERPRLQARGAGLMFYWLYEQLSAGGHVPIFNLLKYLTFRTGMSLFTAQIVVVALGSRFIRWIQAKQGRGQPIRAEGIQRHIVETGIAMAAIALIIVYAPKPPEAPDLLTSVTFPIFKQLLINLNWFYLLFGAFIIVGAANAVNFTDGLDGLATVPMMIAAA